VNKNVKVMKFGGTSVGDEAAIRRVVGIISSSHRESPVVAVISAMSGVTNRLVEAAHEASKGNGRAAQSIDEFLHERHVPVAKALIHDRERCPKLIAELEEIIERVTRLCRDVAKSQILKPDDLDAISSAGERLSCRLVAATLSDQGLRGVPVDATELIVTDEVFGNAEPLMDLTRTKVCHRLSPLVQEGRVPVVTGFIGATRHGVLTTLGRGGSDLSATVLAAALDAAEAIIWTDVDGVLTTDPRIVPEARTVPSISYKEATELAFYGAKVLHPKTLQPVATAGIPVWIKNTFAPERAGTKVTSNGVLSNGKVKAIAAMNEVSLITVGGNGTACKPDTAGKVFSATAQSGCLLSFQSTSHSDIHLLVRKPEIENMVEALKDTLSPNRTNATDNYIKWESDVALVGVVGKDLCGEADIAGRAFSTLGRESIHVYLTAQGSSDDSIAFVVGAEAMRRTVAALHKEFHLERLN
jgi:aspartate kinase